MNHNRSQSILRKAAALFLLLCACTAFGQKEDAGTTAASFLKLGVGARAAGLGFSAFTLADDASAVFWNPAVLAHAPGADVTLNYNHLYADMQHSFIGLALPSDDEGGGAFGAGLIYYTSGSMTRTEAVPSEGLPFTKTGTFANHDGALLLGYGRSVYENLHAGVTLKGIFESTADETAFGGAVDLGLYATFGMADVGLAVRNLGPKLKYKNASSAPLPLQFLAGASVYLIPDDLLVTASGGSAGEGKTQFGAGAEYRYDFIAFRAGYRSGLEDVTGSVKGLTAGVGLYYKQIRLDYAYNTYGDLGGVHLISLGFELGERVARSESRRMDTETVPPVRERAKDAMQELERETAAPAPPRQSEPPVKKEPSGTVTADEVTLFTLPSVHSKAIGRVKAGEQARILDATLDWYLIQTEAGAQGWMLKKQLQVNE